MNERAKALVNAPGSTAPQTELTRKVDIKKALARNLGGHNYGVYASLRGHEKLRVYGVRTYKGVLQVRFTGLDTDWEAPDRVWVEG